jgi:hypothetical protein
MYRFEGMAASGCAVTGKFDAANEADAQRELRARGYLVTRLQEVGGEPVRDEAHIEKTKTLSRDESTTVAGKKQPWLRLDLGRWMWPIWFLAFLVGGSIGLYMCVVHPLWLVWQASGWVETPCTVIESEYRVDTSSWETMTYVKIGYAYSFRGVQYQSDRFDFVNFSSGTSYREWERVIKANPPGTKTVCFVNPARPAEAVLERRWIPSMWWGLSPSLLVLIGVFGLLHCTGVWHFKWKRGSG